MKTLPYQEGTWFAVPLQHGGFALGVVARATRYGKVILCYFFGPRRKTLPTLSDAESLRPENAAGVWRVGDLGLVNGSWPILGSYPSWNRLEWPMPDYVRRDSARRAWRVQYSDTNPNEIISEEREPHDSQLAPNSMRGYVAAAVALDLTLS